MCSESAMIEAVLFDLDETLFDRTQTLSKFLKAQFEAFQRSLGEVEQDAWVTRFLKLDARGKLPKRELYPRILKTFSGDPAQTDALIADYYRNSSNSAIAMPGMDEVWRQLAARQLAVGIVTNGETKLQTKSLNALNLMDRVPVILISEMFGAKKPAPEIFAAAASGLGASAGACLFVGDDPRADIIGAHQAGMRTAWFNPDARPWPDELSENPGPEIAQLLDVLSIV